MNELQQPTQAWSIDEANVSSTLKNIASKLDKRIDKTFRSFVIWQSLHVQVQQAGLVWSDVSLALADISSGLNHLGETTLNDLEVGQSLRGTLHDLIRLEILYGEPSGNHSGLVVAGFGEEDVFPELSEVIVDGTVGNQLRIRQMRKASIRTHGTYIIPFAQSDVIATFMNGISDNLTDYLSNRIPRALALFGHELLQRLGVTVDVSSGKLDKAIHEIALVHAAKFHKNLDKLSRTYHSTPIMKIVKGLPKEELANLAEALIGVTALKRRVSTEEQTVGGPVDVALISKGDGFIWVKRKHYFDLAYNPGFLLRRTDLRTHLTDGSS